MNEVGVPGVQDRNLANQVVKLMRNGDVLKTCRYGGELRHFL